jgi:hypothetical protein
MGRRERVRAEASGTYHCPSRAAVWSPPRYDSSSRKRWTDPTTNDEWDRVGREVHPPPVISSVCEIVFGVMESSLLGDQDEDIIGKFIPRFEPPSPPPPDELGDQHEWLHGGRL